MIGWPPACPGFCRSSFQRTTRRKSFAPWCQCCLRPCTMPCIDHEILIVNDNSTDATHDVLVELAGRHPSVRFIDNPPPNGFGLAVRASLAQFRGDAVAIVMADGSDDPADLVKYTAKLQEGYDCVLG